MWVGVCSLALWCGVIGSVIADRVRGTAPSAPPRAPWHVVVRAQPDGSGIQLLVRRYPNEMIVGRVDAGDERFDERLAELRGAAEERASALNAVT